MLYLFSAILAVVIIALILFLVWKKRRARTQDQFGGFQEWVKNPDFKKSYGMFIEDREQARQALKVPANISPAEIQKMVNQLFVEEDFHFNYDKLELLGPKAVPFLTKALQNPKAAKRFNPGAFKFTPDTPLQRICKLLEPHAPEVVLRGLSRYVDHSDNYVVKFVGGELGRLGQLECISPVLVLLNHEDDYVRSHTMNGISIGLRDNSCSAEFLQGVYPGLIKLLKRDDKSMSGNAPQLMLKR
ncbi:MAG: hypothetical protein R3C11_03750 [Planctomycetaceae bacterium]